MTPMKAKIRSLLKQIAGHSPQLLEATGAGKAYELLVLLEIAEEMHSRKWPVNVIDSTGAAMKGKVVFRQRGGAPSPVEPASNGPNGPSAVEFSVPSDGSKWEIWSGMQFSGRSAARHEFDIAIVPSGLASAVRAKASPTAPFGRGLVSIECKHVAGKGSLDETRAFVSRIYDTTILTSHRHLPVVPNCCVYADRRTGFGTARPSFYVSNQHCYKAIVRSGGFSSGTQPLAAGYFVHRFDNVTVGSANLQKLRTSVVDWIAVNANLY